MTQPDVTPARSFTLGAQTRAAALGLLLLTAGCSTIPNLATRDNLADELAKHAGLDTTIHVGDAGLRILSHERFLAPGSPLAIYIEGDGHAWETRTQPSADPTPVNPMGLRLASLDPAPNLVYLARPGQYLHGTADPRYWLSARFGTDVVATYCEQAERLAEEAGTTELRLVGYSGGGALAALVAADLHRRHADWRLSLYTVGGNLDIASWADSLRITPLRDSLNPADRADTLREIPQVHLTGRRDRQVPSTVLHAYARRLGDTRCLREVVVDADHAGPWGEAWQQVLKAPATCEAGR